MKFQPEKSDATRITAYEASGIYIGTERIDKSLVLGSHGERFDWQADNFESLTEAHFERLGASKPELIIFGSGTKIKFPHPTLIKALMHARIGVETMDTAAACRTYNILAGEGRHVVGAFLIESAC
ncbi:MAG: Mth938-like domain-containing protein [Cytophagales bacterium]|nr:Mth938-like domain-containing protein [Cytophagales bacterium]